MESIKVYHSLWKSGLVAAGCFVFASISLFLLVNSPTSSRFMVWSCLLFFGIGGLFLLWGVLKERITHTPFFLITDESIAMNGGLKAFEVHFCDVESFFLTSVGTASGKAKMIGIQYKKDVEFQKFEDSSKVGRVVRRFNERVAGSQEALPAEGLTIKPKVLCEILNERVKMSQKA